jgi:hypothetical protein
MAAAAPPAAARSACHTPAEVGAMRFRQLQIDLWLAATKCEGIADVAAHYNAYVEKSRPGLIENGRQLNAIFARRGQGGAALDHYLTSMANDAQIRSESVVDYCAIQAVTLERAATLDAGDLPAYAAQVVQSPYGAHPCPDREAGARPVKKQAGKKPEGSS